MIENFRTSNLQWTRIFFPVFIQCVHILENTNCLILSFMGYVQCTKTHKNNYIQSIWTSYPEFLLWITNDQTWNQNVMEFFLSNTLFSCIHISNLVTPAQMLDMLIQCAHWSLIGDMEKKGNAWWSLYLISSNKHFLKTFPFWKIM